MKYLLIAIIVITLLLFVNSYRMLNQIKRIAMNLRPQQPEPKIINNAQYDEEEIIKHLDYIIEEALDEYNLYNIKPLNIEYINHQMEQNIIKYMQDTIPERISSVLMGKLKYIYNDSYIGTFIGGYIYAKVTEYVVVFNQSTDN